MVNLKNPMLSGEMCGIKSKCMIVLATRAVCGAAVSSSKDKDSTDVLPCGPVSPEESTPK